MTPVSHTMAARTAETRYMRCKNIYYLIVNVFAQFVVTGPSCVARQKYQTSLSVFPKYEIPPSMALYRALFNAYEHNCITQVFRESDAISRALTVKMVENFCSQTYKGAKCGWRYIGG
jgi:hypothetical protein